LLLVELGHHVVKLRPLSCDGCQLKLRLGLCEPNGWSVGPEGWHAYSYPVNLWAVDLVRWLRHAEKLPKYVVTRRFN